METKNTGFSRFIRAFFYSLAGLRHVYVSEVAFRQECWVSAVLFLIACFLDVTKTEHIALVGSLVLVLIVEIINSALETVINRILAEIHPLSKQVKDMASAAVLLALINALLTWFIVLA